MTIRPTTQARAIVIGTTPLGDFDLIVRMLVKDLGKISAVAKGARRGSKRLGVQLDIFDCGRLEAQAGRSDLWTLTSFIQEASFRTIRNSLEKVAAASILCEAFEHLVLDDGEDNPGAYDKISGLLSALDSTLLPAEILRILFDGLVDLLSSSGFADPSEFTQRSAHSLERLLNRLQEVTERPLRSRSSVPMLVQALRACPVAA